MTKKNNKICSLRNELYQNYKPINSTIELKKWYKKIIKESKVKVKTIPLQKCKKWKMTKNGVIKHDSGSFYKVEGVRILKSFNRENANTWDQPMFTEPGFDGGILGLLRKKIRSTPHYLINAKFEPGNYNFIQLSPTVQATFSNINKAHGGRGVKYLNYFKSPSKHDCRVLFKQWVSEEGGRLRNKRNLGIVVDHQSNEDIEFENDYKWATLKQIKDLILENAMINPHLRTLVSFI